MATAIRMETLNADPEALTAAASLIQREWGMTGYRVTGIASTLWTGAVLMQVRASDGSEFWVGATRHGSTVHADGLDQANELLRAAIREEERP
jgi:hypothetical protein